VVRTTRQYSRPLVRLLWRQPPFVLASHVIDCPIGASTLHARPRLAPDQHFNEAMFGPIIAVFFRGHIAPRAPSNILLMRIASD